MEDTPSIDYTSTAIGAFVGAGLSIGLSTAFRANSGWTIVWATLGISAGAFLGFANRGEGA